MSDILQNTHSSELQKRADRWALRFREMLDADWHRRSAERLHEALDGLVIESDIEGESALAEAGLELTTYLCSFVDGHVQAPTATQKLQMIHLVDLLSPATRRAGALSAMHAAAGLEAARAAAGTADAPGQDAAIPRQIWSAIQDLELATVLDEAFDERGITHRHLTPNQMIELGLPATGVQCVIVDNASFGVLFELQHRLQATSSGSGARPTFVALLQDYRTDERLRALRAGADHVVTFSADAATMAIRIDKILAARSEEPLRVLIVDDDRSQTRFCAGILNRVGITVECCNDAAAALEALRKGFPDVLLVDLHMPDIDGLALTEILLEMPGSEHVAILFLSGDEEPETRFDALTAGGDDFLAKPIQPRHLIRAVGAHGKRAQRRRRRAVAGSSA
jgi:DNA-binding response OmpR family regulator